MTNSQSWFKSPVQQEQALLLAMKHIPTARLEPVDNDIWILYANPISEGITREGVEEAMRLGIDPATTVRDQSWVRVRFDREHEYVFTMYGNNQAPPRDAYKINEFGERI